MGLIDRLRAGRAVDDGLEWPAWMPRVLAAVAVAAAALALAQRGAFWPPGWPLLLGLVAITPWLLEQVRCFVPIWLAAAVVIAAAAGLLLDPPTFDFAPFLLLVLACECGATMSTRGGAAVVATTCAVLVTLDLTHQYSGSLLWVAGVIAGWAFGFGMRGQVRLLARERAERAALAGRLAADERRRMAREVHDVIAHSLTVTMLHLTAARHALEADRDVDEALDALREAERVGRQATADVRRTVSLLEGQTGATRPAPGLHDLDRLVADLGAAGIEVDYRLRGDAAAVAPTAGVELYRITQESLVNAARHAPGAPVRVVLDVTGDPLRLTVRNAVPAPAVTAPAVTLPAAAGSAATGSPGGGSTRGDGGGRPGAGLGLTGMEQRAALLGGTFRAGPQGEDWCVDVTAPRAPGPP